MLRTAWKTLIRAPLIVMMMVTMSACASNPPVQEMSDARQAIQAAVAAGAAQYADRELSDANRYLADAESSLQKRAYNSAKNAAREAKQWAEVAISMANAAREGGN